MLTAYLTGVVIVWPLLARSAYRDQDVKDDAAVAMSALAGFITAWLWPVVVIGLAIYWTPTALRHTTLLRGIR